MGTESPLEPPEGVWPPCQDSAALGPSEAPRARRQQAILVARQKSDNRLALNPGAASDSQGSQILSGCASLGASGHRHL